MAINRLRNTLRRENLSEIWLDIREAIAGTERDFTETAVGKAIFILAVPMVLEMIMESLFAVVDIFFLSRLGANAVASVGLTESVMTIVYSIGGGLSLATTALVSRRIGEKDKKSAGEAAMQAIMLAFFVSLVIAIPGILYAKEFLLVMGATPEMAQENYTFPAIIFGANSVVMLLFIINAVFRSSGDAAISMRVIFVANLINMVLDPIFIFGLGPIPAMGITGAAIATTTGRSIGVIYQFYLLMNRHHRISITLRDIRIRTKVMWELLRVSVGGIFQNLIATSSWILLVRIIAVFGTVAIAGYTIAIRIIIFALLPAWGLSNAAATLVGQNLGAGYPDRAERSVWITGYTNMILMGVIGLFLVVFPHFFIEIFIRDPGVVAQGVVALRIISIGFIAYGLSMVMVQSFNGSGDTVTPTILNFFGFWIIEIPLAWFFAISLKLEMEGACIAIVIAESLIAVVALWLFRKGKWKLQKV
jgi:putative MATE family efflux protein